MDTKYFDFLPAREQEDPKCVQLKSDLSTNDIWLKRKRVLLVVFCYLRPIITRDLAMIVCSKVTGFPLNFKNHVLVLATNGSKDFYVLDVQHSSNIRCGAIFWSRMSDLGVQSLRRMFSSCRICRRPQLWSPTYGAMVCPLHRSDTTCPCGSACRRNDVFCKSIPFVDYKGKFTKWNE